MQLFDHLVCESEQIRWDLEAHSLRHAEVDHEHVPRRLLEWQVAGLIFAFAPLQAKGFFAFHGFAIAGLLLVIGGVMIISANPIALALMCIAVVANIVVFVSRLSEPLWSYNLHLLAVAWLIIAITLGTTVAGAVFGRGRITYHRIVGSVLLYLLIAVGFAALFAFVAYRYPMRSRELRLKTTQHLPVNFFT